MKKKRILVLTADAGFGHRSASKALVEAIKLRPGEDCEAILSNPLDGNLTPGWLREIQSDYDRIARDLPQLYKLGYDLSDVAAVGRLMENGLRVLLFRSLRAVLRETRPDAIISTYPLYQAPLGSVFAMEGQSIPLVCVVTDLVTVHSIWFSSEADLTVVPTAMVRDLGLAAGLDPARVEVIGIPVHPSISGRADRSKEEIRRELGWKPDLPAFLAVGSKRVSRLPEALDALNHSALPIQLAVAAGGDPALYARLAAMEWHLPVKLYDYVNDMPTMMRAADVIVSKAGGLIVTESLAAGLPLLIVDMLPGQEVGNAEYVARGGAGEIAVEPLQCLSAAFHWLRDDGRLLRERTEAARRLGRPMAAFDIVDRAVALAAAGPRPTDLAILRSRLQELFRRVGERFED